jgi:hypothetical protein
MKFLKIALFSRGGAIGSGLVLLVSLATLATPLAGK